MNQNARKQQIHPWAINAENYQSLKRDRRNSAPKEFSGQDRRDNQKKPSESSSATTSSSE